MMRPGILAALLAVALLVPAAPATAAAPAALPAVAAPVVDTAPAAVRPAAVSDFSFESFDAVYELGVDDAGRSTAVVTETIVAVFPDFDQNRGIVRAIPLRHQGYDFGLEVLSVTDETGTAVAWERDDDGGFAVLALGTDEYVHGRTTYVIRYRLGDVIRHYEDRDVDEFYWDVNGDGWPQTFDRVTARVQLAPALAAALTGDAACYQGISGATDRCEIERDGAAFTASAGPLTGYHTMTIAIGFTADIVVQPERPGDSWLVTVLPWVLLGLALALLVAAIVARAVLWRDPPSRRAIVAEYSPPEPRDLVLDGAVLRRPQTVFPAIVIDLAVGCAVRILDLDPAARPKDRYAIEVVDPDRAAGSSREVLSRLFLTGAKRGKTVSARSLDATAGASVHARLGKGRADATRAGLFAKPVSPWARWLRWAAIAVAAAFLIPLAWAIIHDLDAPLVVVAGVLAIFAAVLVGAVTVAPALLTEAGAQRRDHLLGMREYLTVAEADRMRMLQSPEGAQRVARALGADPASGAAALDRAAIVRLHERLLPWAVLWGVEGQWSRVLAAEYAEAGAAAGWMSSGAFDASVLTWAATTSSRIVPLASTDSGGSSWSGSGGSSFSSGSSGGGFAGGGGGGGGGGGR